MSRSGYTDDCEDNWAHICWRGAVKSAISGKRGQAFLAELLAAMDAMPQKQLITNDLQSEAGEFCALGAVGAARGTDMSKIDPDDRNQVSKAFGIAEAMAAEIMYENDEMPLWMKETPEQRFSRMRAWIVSNLRALAAQ